MAKQYALVFDLKRCLGCHACTVACKLGNDIRSGSWIRVYTVEVLNMDMPKGNYPHVSMFYLPRTCNHCNPPCMDACPTSAI